MVDSKSILASAAICALVCGVGYGGYAYGWERAHRGSGVLLAIAESDREMAKAMAEFRTAIEGFCESGGETE